MQCADVLDLVEPIAAGDLLPDERVREHLYSCSACAGALASAQRLEALLKGMEFPAAPAAFASQHLFEAADGVHVAATGGDPSRTSIACSTSRSSPPSSSSPAACWRC